MPESTIALSERLAIRDRLKATLTGAQRQRDRRPDIIDTPHGPECEWVRYERNVMLDAVNAERAELGKPPALINEVESMDRMAAGHVDYTDKFSLYCTELVVDRP
ncbi:hypothetical protein [Actinomadura decatromicini]|uniref:Uncharacterized protein n=1 Tax=Actinomadura decatromicini TaxID=2604572 RepID=A0A5D3FCN7_9ACTN|nr:hypothetical protein [Actinomadura decatromicini]TYK45095.1 hypothetical protein FXF68_30910 [Actinomadura decatromicini]